MNVGKIEKVATMAASNEQRSATGVKVQLQEYEGKRGQLDQLVQFKQEYEARLEAVGEKGVEVRQLLDYRLFLNKLHLAIEQQQNEVEVANENLTVAREDWQAKAQRKNAINNLVEQGHRDQLFAREKTEQKESDERNLSQTSV